MIFRFYAIELLAFVLPNSDKMQTDREAVMPSLLP